MAMAMMLTACDDLGAGVRKTEQNASSDDVQAQLAAQKTEMEALMGQAQKEQAQTLENMEKARAEAIKLAEDNAEAHLAEKTQEFQATLEALDQELKNHVQMNQRQESQLAALSQSQDLPYTLISAKHQSLIKDVLQMEQIDFAQADENGHVTVYPNQILQLVSAIEDHTQSLKDHRAQVEDLLSSIMRVHREQFQESPSTVLIEAKIRRAHIQTWTDQGQVYLAALSQSHPQTTLQWLIRLNDQGVFGQPKATISQKPVFSIQVAKTMEELVPMQQHANAPLFSFLKQATSAQAKAYGFFALPMVGNQVMQETPAMRSYIEDDATIEWAKKLDDQSFQLVLTDRRDV
jgi:hypothetical protein